MPTPHRQSFTQSYWFPTTQVSPTLTCFSSTPVGSGCYHLLPHHSTRPFAGLLEFIPASCPSFSQSVQDNLHGHTKLMATPFPQSLACFLLLWDKTALINLLHLFLSLPCSSLQSHPSFMLKVLPGFSPHRGLRANMHAACDTHPFSSSSTERILQFSAQSFPPYKPSSPSLPMRSQL